MAKNVPMFERNTGDDGTHGTNFEWEATLLSYLRCEKLHQDWKRTGNIGVKSFRLANNVSGVGAFDDIVVRVEYEFEGETKTKVIFVQCKHVIHDGKDDTDERKFQNYLSTEEIQKYFNSFVTIYQSVNDEPGNDKNLQEKRNALKSFLNCKFSECEFIFLSNINHVPRDYLEQVPSTAISQITTAIFSSTNTQGNEYRLVAEKCKKFLKCVREFKKRKINWLLTEFCERFRLVLNQDDTLNVQIESAMKNIKGEKINLEILRTEMSKEIKRRFIPISTTDTKKNKCAALTEKTDMLSKMMSFLDLKRKSAEILDSYPQQIKLCAKEIIGRISKSGTTTVKTQYKKIMKIKIYRAFIDLKKDNNLCIIMKDEGDVEKFMFVRDTCKYRKVEKVYIFLENLVDIPQTRLENEYFVRIEHDESEKRTRAAQELSDETIAEIESTSVSLQGCDVKLCDVCSNWKDILDEDDICAFLKSELPKIASKVPPKSSLYVNRRFETKVFKEKTVEMINKEHSSDCNKPYIIFSEQKENIFDGAWFQCVKTIAEASEILGRFSTSTKSSKEDQSDTINLCMYKNKYISFMHSVGEKSNCLTIEKRTEECNLVDNSKNIGRLTILTGVAGMGKTTSMASLALKYKENHPSHLVHFIELSKHIQMFQNTKDIDNATEFIAKDILELKGLEYKFFVNACNKTGHVALFFDAFDEITLQAEKKLSHLLFELLKTTIAKIFVSSRPKCVQALEKTLLQQAITFVEFSTEEKEKCLMKFWTQKLKLEDKKKLDTSLLNFVVQKIIKSLESEEKLLNKLIAIPLQILMVAKVYYKKMLAILKKEESADDVEFDLINLYKNYINSHVEHFLTDKWTVDPNKFEDRHIRERLKGPSKLAYNIVVHHEWLKNTRQDQQDVISALFHDFGLLANQDPPIFLHRTIAEYLAAQYIVSYLFSKECNKATTNALKKILMEDTYEVVRIFINSLLNVTNLPLYFNNIDENEKKVTYADGLNNPIHVAATEGNMKLLEALLNKDKSLISLKNEYGETALSCACRSVNADIGRLLIKHNCSVDTVDKKGNNVLHCASYNGNVEILKFILNPSTNAYITADLETLTLSDNQKLLLNMQNDNGCTPLHCAVHRGKLNVVEFLIEQPDCKLDIVDKFRGNALHNAAHYNNVDIMKVLLQRDIIPLDMLNKRNKTALQVARSRGNVEAAELLYNANAKHTS